MRNLIAVFLVLMTSLAFGTPCDGIDRSLTSARRAVLTPIISGQMQAKAVDVLQSYRYASWSIIYVDTHEADRAFLFFVNDPLATHYVTLWSGAASHNEEHDILQWTLKNAPGITAKLARCFAWHVTNDRDL